ncbi:flagellar filament capping protein FliD [Bowmanella pacifica]|uniref:Flagellar hook-associated protein 2 n=2 Tax=Bowmanella TaxID=366580 RepID=A0A917YYN3_9ALTE|nr:flagellar filament capping protein FliD [Bowmanella pacifica]GGO69341.1 lateral flagellar hook-associated protein 2 [Bowmanella pacifica]
MSSALSIDPAHLAQQYTQIERAAKDQSLQRKHNLFSSQIKAFNNLKSSLSDFLTKLENFQSDNSLLANQATSSNTALAVTADSNAVPGSYDIFVEQLAQAQQLAMTFDPDAPLATDGQLDIDVAGTTFSVDLATLGAGATVKELASAINNHADNSGVRATLMRSGTDTFLVLTSEESGLANQINLNFTAGADPAGADMSNALAGMQELTQAQDAIVKMGANSSVTITSSSNKMEGVIEGVTLDLKQAQSAGDSAIRVEVGQDNDATKENIQGFVDQYNAILASIDKDQSLKDDSLAKSMERQLRGAFQGTFEGKTLYSVGLEFDRFGKLKIDSGRLEKALADNPQQFTEMLTGPNGVMAKLETAIDPYASNFGIVSKKTQTLQASLDLVIDKQKRHDYSMDMTYKRYLSQFTQMQVTIAQLESSMGQF